jgi:hypothetical protein
MPVALLDSQFATLQEPTPDEHPITVDVGGRPADIATEIVRQLEETAGDSDEAGVEHTSGRSGAVTGVRR